MKTVSHNPPGFPFQYKKYHPYHCGARLTNATASLPFAPFSSVFVFIVPRGPFAAHSYFIMAFISFLSLLPHTHNNNRISVEVCAINSSHS